MARFKLSEEIKRKAALEQAVNESQRMAYPTPVYFVSVLKKRGTKISRQAVRAYLIDVGIVFDSKKGQWVEKGNLDGKNER